MRHLTQNELVLFYYREKDGLPRPQVEEHLQSCDECRQALANLMESLTALELLPVPKRGASYGAEVWSRIRPHLPESAGKRWRFFFPWRTWALAGSMAGVLIIAFLAGRIWQQRQAPAAVISAPARERILLVAVGDHLDRAQMLLIEIMNQEVKGPVDFSREKLLAQDLVQSNRLYRQTTLRTGQFGIADTLDELERVLLHIAHSPSEVSAGELESLQHRIEARGILFKVRVIGLDLQKKQKESVENSTAKSL